MKTYDAKIKTLAALLVVLVALFSAFTLRAFETRARKTLLEQHDLLISRVAQNVEWQIGMLRKSLASVASTVPPAALNDSEVGQRFLEQNAGTLALFDRSIFLFDVDGKLIAESPFLPGRRGQDFSFRDYIVKTLRDGKPSISAPFVTTKNSHDMVLMFTAPIFSDGKIIGILGGSVDLGESKMLAQLTQNTQGGDIYLTTRDRTIIIHPQHDRIMKLVAKLGENPLYDLALQGIESATESMDASGKPLLVSYKTIKSADWVLGASLPASGLLSPIERFTEAWTAISIFVIIGMVLLGLGWRRALNKQLTQLTSHLQTGTGPLSSTLKDVQQSVEIQALTQAIINRIEANGSQKSSLVESEKKYRLIANNAIDIISVHTIQGLYLYASPACNTILGYSPDALVGHCLFDFIHPGDTKLLQDEFSYALAGKVRKPVTYRMRCNDQAYLLIESTFKKVFNAAEMEIVCVSRDISQRKQPTH